MMLDNAAVNLVVERIRRDIIGGAADTSKEIADALAEVARASEATDAKQLAAEMLEATSIILDALSSLAPPLNVLHRVMGAVDQSLASGDSIEAMRQAVLDAVASFHTWAETALQRVAQYGAETIHDGDRVFMYSMSSTVWRILKQARAQGKKFSLIVTESRPDNEGLWTVIEMDKIGIPVSVSIDACIGELVPQCNVAFVGADAITANGFSLCKTGTYPTALVAQAHGVPFYVAADTSKLDPTSLLGLPFRIEPIGRYQVLSEQHPKGTQVVGQVFDLTPPHLVTGLITEQGIIHPTACFAVMHMMKLSESLNKLLPAWAHQGMTSQQHGDIFTENQLI